MLQQLKVKRRNALPYFTYVLFTLCYLIVLLIWGMGTSISQIRYYVLFAATLIIGISMIVHRKKRPYGKTLMLVIPLGILFYVISLSRAMAVHHEILFRTYVQISLIVLPALYAMFLLNLLEMSSLIKLMQFTLVCTVIIYFIEPGHRIMDFLNMNNYLSISILHSNSFTESDICSEIFFELFAFFNFYRNANGKDIKRKNMKICYYVALIFTILSFKRLAMLFVICILLLNKIIDWRGSISKYLVPGLAVFFTIATVLYAEFMKGNLLHGFDIYNFTTGRDYILSLWGKLDYVSYGYGSSVVLIGRYLEMDLVQIYMELNILALFVFAYVFFKIAGTNVYSVVLMIYSFLNMLTASNLPGSLSWIITFITIASISSDKCEREQIYIVKLKSKIKKFFSKRKKGKAKYV